MSDVRFRPNRPFERTLPLGQALVGNSVGRLPSRPTRRTSRLGGGGVGSVAHEVRLGESGPGS